MEKPKFKIKVIEKSIFIIPIIPMDVDYNEYPIKEFSKESVSEMDFEELQRNIFNNSSNLSEFSVLGVSGKGTAKEKKQFLKTVTNKLIETIILSGMSIYFKRSRARETLSSLFSLIGKSSYEEIINNLIDRNDLTAKTRDETITILLDSVDYPPISISEKNLMKLSGDLLKSKNMFPIVKKSLSKEKLLELAKRKKVYPSYVFKAYQYSEEELIDFLGSPLFLSKTKILGGNLSIRSNALHSILRYQKNYQTKFLSTMYEKLLKEDRDFCEETLNYIYKSGRKYIKRKITLKDLDPTQELEVFIGLTNPEIYEKGI